MILYRRLILLVVLMLVLAEGYSYAGDPGLFRMIPVETPRRGTLSMANSSFYSPIEINTILRNYGITDPHIFSSLTSVQYGLTDHFALTGTVPFYVDLYNQNDKSGRKSGPGDVLLGLRTAVGHGESFLRGFSIGGSVCIPEQFGYGEEPLGFRDFSTGEFGYSIETSLGLRILFFDGYLSAAFRGYPKSPDITGVDTDDTFYSSGFGYLGIGKPDASGRAGIIYQDQATLSFGSVVPFKSWISGIVEASLTAFTEKPGRDNIVSIAPGIRIGRQSGINLSVGVDLGISGQIPDQTYIMRLDIPYFSPGAIKIGVKEPVDKGIPRSMNSLVAVGDFSNSDITYMYERELKDVFHKKLSSPGILNVIPETEVSESFQRMELVPGKKSPGRIGVRLGANYLIDTDISEYNLERRSAFTIPLLISFPETMYSLSAQASVTDLATGETRNLGLITASINKKRGVNMFPYSASSDMVYLSEPQRIMMQKALIDRWVDTFNEVLHTNMDVFGWEPKRTETRGDEDISG
ncbi:hypothetical protein ACFL1R_06675 [Candidatus Latescibacterota bacterium]